MGAPKPSLGFPSRTAAAQALRDQGLTQGEIAKRIGISTNSVGGLLACAKRHRAAGTKPQAGNTFSALLPLDLRIALRRHAYKRDVTLDRLVLMLLERVASDGLVDAVLDDEERSS